MITVNDRDHLEWHEGLTVADVLRQLGWDFALIIASVNGRHVPTADYETTPIPDHADVRLLHVMHGG